MKRHLYILLVCGIILPSCRHYKGLYSDYVRPDSLTVPTNLYRSTLLDSIHLLATDTVSFGSMPWREVFTDRHLQQLIERALTENTDIRKADLNIRKAEQGLRISRVAFLPQISFNPQGTVNSFDFGKAVTTYSVPIQASWQVDIFGTLRNTKKQAEMGLYQTRAAKQAAQTAIICAVANLYYTLEMLDEQLATTRATAELWKKNVEAMEIMWQAGWANAAAVSQTKANLLSILTNIPAMENSIRQAENALCTLLHEPSQEVTRGILSDVHFPARLSAGLPLQLLYNRPDVRAAELQMAYAYYGVLGARGAFYPQLTLSGSIGWTNNAGVIVNPGKILASFVGGLTQPLIGLLPNSKLRANLELAKIEQELASLNFQQRLLDAGNEVNDALSAYQTATQRIKEQTNLVGELEQAVEQTEYIFRTDSSVSYLETLAAQQNLLQARLNLVSSQFDKIQAAISLYQALGGGN